ncbi:MAG: MFS transporter [Thermodesulfobacteriota bacterium]
MDGIINDQNRKWVILAMASLGFGLIMLDETVVAISLPTMQHDLSMNVVQSHWIINSYLLVIAGFIAVGGKLGDITGYKTLFVTGVLIFGIFSLAAGFAQNAVWILTARAMQGLGGAIIFPASMALLALTFPAEQRGMAMGIYGAIGSSCSALGPIIGGFLTNDISWRWIFWINFPIVLLILVVFLAAWREPKLDAPRPHIDLWGLVTLVIGISSLVLAIMQGPEWGWGSSAIISLFAVSAVFLVMFYVVELKVKEPLIEIDLFKNGTFSSSNLAIFTGQYTKIAVIVFGALYLQQVLKMDPLKAGVMLFPALVPIPFMAVLAGNATDKYGPRNPVLIGLFLGAIALFAMGLTAGTDRYLYLVPTLVLWGISVSWMFAPALVAVMNAVPAEKQGQASGIVLTAQIFGATIGLAILSAVLNELHNFRIVFISTSAVAVVTLLIGWLYLERDK